MRKLPLIGLIIFIIGLSIYALSSAGFQNHAYRITQYELVEDVNGEYSFDTVSAPDFANQFKPYQHDTIALGITRSVYWFRFTVPMQEAYQLLQINNVNINNLDIFIPTVNGYVHKVGGVRSTLPREILDTTWVFSLTDQCRQNEYLYFRVESTSALRLGVSLWPTNAFISENFLKNIGFGLFYGVILAMLCLNLFSFFILKDRTYLFYVLYISLMLIYQLQVHGHFRWLFTTPYVIYNAIFWLCLGAAYIAAILFTCSFLQVRLQTKPWNKILGVLVTLAIAQGILGALQFNIAANQIAHALGFIEPFVIMSLAVIRLRQGFRSAKYYLLAWGILSTGIIVWALSAYIPGMTFAVNYLLVTTAAESILLTCALADRFRNLRMQAKYAQYYRDLSLTDELTGLYNKRYLKEKCRQEVDLALQNKTPLSLMIIDVDHFKNYNDRHGHLAGDQVLSHLGQILLNLLEETQLAFRFGGEEYVILLPDTTCDKALLLAEKIRAVVQAEKVRIGANVTGITVSIGISELQSDDTYDKLFQRMDKALYTAKETGRNRVIYA